MGLRDAGGAAATAANARRGGAIASGARLLCREPAGSERQGEAVAGLDAALSQFSGGFGFLSQRQIGSTPKTISDFSLPLADTYFLTRSRTRPASRPDLEAFSRRLLAKSSIIRPSLRSAEISNGMGR